MLGKLKRFLINRFSRVRKISSLITWFVWTNICTEINFKVLWFYTLQSGSVTIGGENIQRMRVRSLRDAIGVVSQEPVLFATTIAENIRWGRKGISDKQVHMAARQANAFGFISRLPKVKVIRSIFVRQHQLQ